MNAGTANEQAVSRVNRMSQVHQWLGKLWFALASIVLPVVALAAADVTGVRGSFSNNTWVSTTATANTSVVANGANDLLSFTANGATYSTGVNDAALSAGFTPATFQAFVPNAATILTSSGYNAIALSGTYNPAHSRAWYLTDGAHGLDLSTALFNIPISKLKFDVTVSNVSDPINPTRPPDVLVTQVGQPSNKADLFYFVNAANQVVGNQVSALLSSVPIVGKQNWQFWSTNHVSQPSLNGPRDLRMRAYYFSDFGITAANMGDIAGFVQELSGDSDVAFIAYNTKAVTTPARLRVQKTNEVNFLLNGQASQYTVTLTNDGGDSVSNVQWVDSASNLSVSQIAPTSVPTGSNGGNCTPAGCTGITLLPGASVVYTVTGTVTGAAGSTVSNTASVHGANCNNGSPSDCTYTDTDPVVPEGALVVFKSNEQNQVTAGGQTIYKVTLSNGSSTPFSNLSWADTPGTGLTVTAIAAISVGAGSSAGTCVLSTRTCNGITLAAGSSIVYSVVATVSAAAGSNVSNQARVSGGSCNPGGASCTSTDTDVVVSAASLEITKTNNVSAVASGGNTIYIVTVRNTGGTASTVVSWTDTPAGVSVNQITETSVGANSHAGVCTTTGCSSIVVGAGESVVYEVDATVTGAAGVGAARNTATLTGANCTGSTLPAVCTAIDTDDIVSLAVAKTNGVEQLAEGATTTYTVTLINGGGAVAGVNWTDTSADMNITAITSLDGTSGTCAITPTAGCQNVSIAANSSARYSVTAEITALVSNKSTVTNTVSVNGANCTAAAPCTVADTDKLVTATHFTVAKTAPAVVLTGQALTYTFTISNSGQMPSDAGQLITVADTLPTGVSFISATPAPGVTSVQCADTPLLCTVTLNQALAQNATASFTLQTTAPSTAGSITNYASIDAGGGANPPAPGSNCAPTSACTSATTQVNTPASLAITKTNGVTQLTEGATTTYTVSITNTGGTAVSGAEWRDTPNGLLIQSITPVAPANGVCRAGDCTGVDVPANSSVSYTVIAQVTALASSQVAVSNTASVLGAQCTVANPCSATDTDNLLTPAAFTVLKTAPSVVQTNQSLSYAFTIRNSGQTASGSSQVLTIAEQLPAGVTYVGAAAGTGVDNVNCAAGSPVICTVTLNQALPQNATASFTLQTTAPSTAGEIINYASIDAGGGSNPPAPGSNCTPASACTSAQTQVNTPSSLVITKTNGVSQLTEGATTTYTVSISNSGGTAVSGAEWTDTPNGLVIQSITPVIPANGVCNASGCTGVDVPANGSVSYTVTAQVTALVSSQATVSNTASVLGAQCTAVSPCSTTDTDNLLTPASLSITKTNGVTQLTEGATTTYTVSISNSGGTAVSGAEWTDTPNGLVIQSITPVIPANGVCNASGCTGVDVPANGSVSYTVTAQVTALVSSQATVSNTASVLGAQCTAANPCSDTDTDNLRTPASLTVTKTNGVSQLAEGATTTYTVTITNTGGTSVANVQWTDTPSLLTVNHIALTAAGSQSVAGVCTTTGCTGITLAAGESVSYAVDAVVTGAKGATASNTASVVGGDGCTSAAPCTSTDSDLIVAVPVVNRATPVPVDSRAALLLLGLLMLGVAWRALQRARQ